jgi:hypothetical protein
MADYAADAAGTSAGAALTPRTGTAAADTVPAGAYVIWRNTGAGSHTVTLTNNQLVEGLAVAARVLTLAASEVRGSRVPAGYADANGRVQVAINGTAAEVTYYIVGNV